MAFLDETGLAELWSLTKAHADTKARVQLVSYAGTGTLATSSSPKTMTFSFKPKIVISLGRVYNGSVQSVRNGYGENQSYIPIDMLTSSFKKYDMSPWDPKTYMKYDTSANKLSWYSTEDSSVSGTSVIFNTADATYYWLAIG